MYILGADTSCDDTSCGIIQYDGNEIKILANEIESQLESTTKNGGVIPNICASNHCLNMTRVFQRALESANLNANQIDIYSSTFAPGMIGSLILGNTFVGTLAQLLQKTYIPVHHIEAHISVANINPPFLALVVSGGHTLIAKYEKFGEYKILCSSLDDAAGEVFDKIGREMSLPFPSGSYLEKLAAENTNTTLEAVTSMKKQLAFSFSGIKTAHKKMLQTHTYQEVAYSLQESIGETIVEKLKLAMEVSGINKLVACGGVMCNISIREKIKKISENCYFPPVNLCSDNGVMIAFSALNHWKHKSNMINNFNLTEKASISLEEWSSLIKV